MGTKGETTATRRARRTRYKLRQINRAGLPRLSVHRSNKQIYAQVIDDQKGTTIVSASTVDKDLRGSVKNGGTIEAAKKVGELLATRAKEAKLGAVQFDRGSYLYHGRVKALAETARAGGMQF
jgi:large subunit ribosomal protein L18